MSGLSAILIGLILEANREDFAAASSSPDAGDFMGSYGRAFVRHFMEAGEAFRDSTGNVGDFLDAGSREEERIWRTALAAVVPRVLGTAQSRPSPSTGATAAPRFVIYHYCVSLGIVSFRRSSAIKLVQPGAGAFLAGLPYTIVSLLAGWWGIPWGPLWTIETVVKNLMGGTDVTDAVYAATA